MPLYVVPPADLGMRRAVGADVAAYENSVRLESQLATDYALSKQSITREDGLVAPVTQAGDLITTSRGDYITVQETIVSPSDGPRIEESVKLDVGGGSGALVTVTEDEYGIDDAARLENMRQTQELVAYRQQEAALFSELFVSQAVTQQESEPEPYSLGPVIESAPYTDIQPNSSGAPEVAIVQSSAPEIGTQVDVQQAPTVTYDSYVDEFGNTVNIQIVDYGDHQEVIS